jgi:hypothetical protein
MSGRTAARGCMEPQSLFPPVRSRRRMLSKAHPTQCGKIAIDLTLATISRHVFSATYDRRASNRRFGQFIRSNQLDKYTCRFNPTGPLLSRSRKSKGVRHGDERLSNSPRCQTHKAVLHRSFTVCSRPLSPRAYSLRAGRSPFGFARPAL